MPARKIALLLLLATVFATPVAQAQGIFERFNLLTRCAPLALTVERLDSDAAVIGLTKASLRYAVESRLRAARIFTEEYQGYRLYLNVDVVGRAYSIDLRFWKALWDPFTESWGGMTWDVSSTGTTSRADFIRSSVAEHMDKFLTEYLRVNEGYCE